MKRIFTILLLVINSLISNSQNIWTQKSNFGGVPRYTAAAFSIGTKIYIGTGLAYPNYFSDFWSYDPATDIWTQVASIPGGGRSNCVSFSIGTKGYLGLGFLNSTNLSTELWEYDPSTNNWTQKTSFPGMPRSGAVGFSIGNKGYVGLGGTLNDFWEYDPSTNLWTQKSYFPGGGKSSAVGFSIGSYGYVGTGQNNNGVVTNDFWRYDPSTNIWIQKSNFGGDARESAVGFSIGTKGYLGTGFSSITLINYNDFWEYDPSTDIWTQKMNISNIPRSDAIGVSNGTYGFIGTGQQQSTPPELNDFWEYTPSSGGCIGVTISQQPQDQTAIVGNTATFTIGVNGTLPFTFQWYKNGSPISGAVNSYYTTPPVTLGDNGSTYYCFVTNCSGTNNMTSNTAILTVTTNCVGVVITQQPLSQTATAGNTATFAVGVYGTPPFTYQWYKNSIQLNGEINLLYTTPILTMGDNGNTYYCKVTNCSGTNNMTSNTAILTVTTNCVGVVITQQPLSQTTTAGNTATFTVGVTGTPPFTYQWYKNGSPISSAIYSSYITPPVNLGDDGNTYYCYITNCSGSNSVISNVVTLSVTNGSSSSQVIIKNVIHNNSTFTPLILWSGNTNQSPSTIKICADASTSTQITFVNNTGINSNNIRFWIASDPYGSNSAVSGYFVTTDYNYNGTTISAKLTHPKYLGSSYSQFRPDAIQIVDYTNPTIPIFSIPIQIYRAPVIMIHGIWGNIDSFNNMETYLDGSGLYPTSLTLNLPYSSNAVSFYQNRDVVPTRINNVLYMARNEGFSAGKVDVICHSMGGNLARYYLQSSTYQQKQDIHKLITLNTPHSGSPFGNLLTNTTSYISDAARVIGEIVAQQVFNSSIYYGAINDLAINSNAMDYLNYSTLNNGIAPSHTIITKSAISDDGVFYLILVAVAPIAGMTVSAYTNYFFYGDLNDIVVAVPSQSGGLPYSSTSTISNQWHMGSPDNSSVQSEVVNALNTNSSNSSFFAQSGFSPSVLHSHYKFSIDSSFNNPFTSGNINITYPTQNQHFNPGDLIPITITSSQGISRIILEGITTSQTNFVCDTSMSNGTIIYTVPEDSFGKIKFIALGYDQSNLLGYDTVSIIINQMAALDSINSYNKSLYLQVNNIIPVSTKAYFNNNYSYNISNLENVQYQIWDTTVATNKNLNIIFGKKVGTTFMTIKYLGQSCVIPIYVFPQDTTITSPNGINSQPQNNQVLEKNPIQVYPNPNNGEFTIKIDSKIIESITTEIYNQYGQLILVQHDKSSATIYLKQFSLHNVSSGIYYIKVQTTSNSYTNKIIIIKG